MKQLIRLSIVLLALILPVTASAYSFEVDGIYYEDWGDYCVAVVSGDNQYTGDVTIPETVTYDGTTYSVNWIGDESFYECIGLTDVTIPNSVTCIGWAAFCGCSSLTGIDIPNSVTEIYGYAFYNCSGLTGTLTIPNSVTFIEYGAFFGCSGLSSIIVASGNSYYDSRDNCNALIETSSNTLILGCKNTIIPNTVTAIGDNSFYGCSGLTSISIPNSVTNIGSGAFSGCSGLSSIIVESGNLYYDSRDNCNALIETSSNTLILGCKNTIIPNTVTAIGDNSFYGCSGLASISIPDSVTTIGSSAFYNCSGLTSVTIGNSVQSIGNYAFQGCTSLVTLDFNAVSCSNFNSSASYQPFYDLNISTINIGDSVQRIPAYFAYGLVGLTHISIGNSVQSIGNYAFQGCTSLTTLNFNAVSCSNFSSTASYRPFNGLNISTINIGDSVQRIPAYFAYGLTELTHISIPQSVTEIGSYAFYNCSGITDLVWNAKNCSNNGDMPTSNIVHVTIGNEVETIPNSFANGSKITELSIPNSVLTIGNYAFGGCSGLSGNLTIPNSVTSIGNYAFQSCNGLSEVTIGNSVTSIGYDAFQNCSGLTGTLTIPNSVTYIDSYAFSGCSGLTSISIPNSINAINEGTFYYCSGLTSVSIPNSVTSIGYYAFQNCSGLTSVTIPNSVTYIDSYAFSGCSGLTSISIPNSINAINEGTFYYCSGLTSVTIPNSVTTIGSCAFQNCYNLRFMTWNAVNCTSIGYRAFYGVYDIYSLQFGENVEHIPAGLPSLYMYGQFLKIPNSVKTIDAGAIQGGYAGVVIGNGLENIPASAFSTWDISVAYATTAEPLPCEAGAFANPQTLYVPAGSKMKYFTASGWSEFANIIEGEYYPATAIELDKDSVRLYKDNSLQLTATVLPDTASATSIGWFSTNYDVAWVEDDGIVYANAVGEADIIVWVDQVMDTCHVTVTPVMVENITLSANHMSMALDETYKLTATVTPENAENQTLEWEIPDNEVLLTQLVNNKNLNIGAAGEGTVTITVRATDGSGVSASCEVFVSANTPVKTLTLSPETLNLYVGYSEQLNAIITPQDAYTQELRWMSSNENVVTVNSNGLVTARGVGNATITAITTDGSNLSATCAVSVTTVPVESVTLNRTELEMNEGSSYTLSATVLPSDAYDRSLTWTSSNPSVATVNYNGRVTAVGIGSTIVTAITNDGTNISAACHVTVKSQMANDCFVIPDTEVLYGESVVIPVRLNNVRSFMAFQTDIFLPQGFKVAKDDNGKYIVTPSSRMTSDHVIMTQDVSNGAVRVICYTPIGSSFTGGSGTDLFYITVTAPEDAGGDYSINLRNSRLTTANYTEVTIPNAGAVLKVKTFIPGDVNNSRTVTVTDIVVTAQHILEMNPEPFVFEAADMNADGLVTVTDIMLIAQKIMNPSMYSAPKRMPALLNADDRMSGEDISLMAGETRTVTIALDNTLDYSAFQLDLTLPYGLTASNFTLTDRAGSHILNVNTLEDGDIRALCYSTDIKMIDGHSGALLTFDVSAAGAVEGLITVDGIELVTTDCKTVLLDGFTIGVHGTTSVNELNSSKEVARVDYFNLAGQRIDRPDSGVTIVVTTYTDGTRSTTKLFQ